MSGDVAKKAGRFDVLLPVDDEEVAVRCRVCGFCEVHEGSTKLDHLYQRRDALDREHECISKPKPPLPMVVVITDDDGVAKMVNFNGYEIADAQVDVDMHAGRVTLSFPAKVVIS